MSEKSNQERASLAAKVFVSYLVVAATTGLLYFLFLIRPVVLQVIIAVIVALALEPLVRLLVRKGIGR
ncbi:MAG TPA: hypothetical protein VF272_02680, partial [Candidatus Saccharimonadia bacterium]